MKMFRMRDSHVLDSLNLKMYKKQKNREILEIRHIHFMQYPAA